MTVSVVPVFTDLDRLRVAFQADGSYSSRSKSYTGARTGTVAIRFSLKKERKKSRLLKILKNLDFEYSWSEYENGYCSVRIKIPTGIITTFSKNLRESFKGHISQDFAKELVDELKHWDGSSRKARINNIFYSSIIEDNILFLQKVASIAGYTATYNKYVDKRVDSNRKPIYNTNINLNKEK